MAKGDPRVTGVVARIGNGGLQVGHAQELRDAIHSFRRAGKKTIAYSESFGEGGNSTVDYYVATAFESIVLMPKASASIHGLVGRGRFVRGLLDKLGVVPDMGHRREYKAAMYMLTETSFTEPHRESVSSLTGELFDQIVSGIAEDRSLTAEQVRSAIDRSPLNADEALELGLVDQLIYRDEAYQDGRW